MKVKYSGTICYANGDPVPGVEVRIFDKDTPGKQDDDLTVVPGISDAQGHFNLTYEPLRFLDYHVIRTGDMVDEPFNTPVPSSGLKLPDLTDIYLPYLRFTYMFNEASRHYSVSLGIFRSKYNLPENRPVEFIPSNHGYKFLNSFSGYFLPVSTPAFLSPRKVTSVYGLCGGMCFSAYDFILAGKPIPQATKIPRQGTRLHRYLFRRQIDSMGPLGQQIVKVAQWTSMPDDTLLGTQTLSAAEFSLIRSKLDDKNLVTLALIYEHAATLKELTRLIFNNHQVLAYAYQQEGPGSYKINIYDPNLPGRDDIVIRCNIVPQGEVTGQDGSQTVMGLKCTQLVDGAVYKQVRGFFVVPYVPVAPPNKV